MQVTAYTETDNAQKNFYPTPIRMIDKMLSGIDWNFVQSVLEPSAGKGDIAREVCRHFRYKHNDYGKDLSPSKYDVDCVEIDPNLRAILKDGGFRVIHDDFLTMETMKHYDLIVMNPPFDKGAEHLLKAMRMQERGGAVICLLNADTLRNQHTYIRKVLARELERLNAEITYHDDAFFDSERRTRVTIAMVKCTIPEQKEDSTILDALRRDADTTQEDEQNSNDLEKTDYIDAIIDRFSFEVRAGVKLIREYDALLPYLMDEINGASPIMELNMRGSKYEKGASVNKYIKETRKKYWKALFRNPEFVKTLTQNLQSELYNSVEKFADYDFTAYNIMELRVQMSKKVITGIESTIMALFDDWTRKYHWDENSTNRHYFDGWRTNDAFKIEGKVIIPMYGVWDWGKYHPSYEASSRLSDIQKTFDFLDGKPSGGDSIGETLRKAENDGQTKKIPLRYFNVTFYKKGTCHIEFTNNDVLQRFNLFAARGKGWLPPTYGKKAYKDMSKEERKVVDSFEGEESYNRVMLRRDYFLGDTAPIALAAGTA